MQKFKIYLTLTAVLLAGVLAGCDWFKDIPEGVNLPDEESNIEANNPITDAEDIKQLLVSNYAASPRSLELDIQKQNNTHARRIVRIGKLPTKSANFFAYKKDKQWKLAFEGNGPVACGYLEEKDFPAEMIDDCFGSEGKGEGFTQFPEISAEDCSNQDGKLVKIALGKACSIGEFPIGIMENNICCAKVNENINTEAEASE